jgi:hypothetical protein
MTKLHNLHCLLAICTILLFFTACQKNDDDIPSLESAEISEDLIVKDISKITQGSASFKVTNYLTKTREMGICWSDKDQEPTIKDLKSVQYASSKDFDVLLKTFKEETTYYVRAYVIQDRKILYSRIKFFTTLEKDKKIPHEL